MDWGESSMVDSGIESSHRILKKIIPISLLLVAITVVQVYAQSCSYWTGHYWSLDRNRDLFVCTSGNCYIPYAIDYGSLSRVPGYTNTFDWEIWKAANIWNGYTTKWGLIGNPVHSGSNRNVINAGSLDSNALAVASYELDCEFWFLICWIRSNRIVRASITFNTRITWGTMEDASRGIYDIEKVAIHEFGHWVALRDVRDIRDTVMYYAYRFGSHGYLLYQGDIDCLRYVYR